MPTTGCGSVVLAPGIPMAFPTKRHASQSSLLSPDRKVSLAVKSCQAGRGHHSVIISISGSERLTRYQIVRRASLSRHHLRIGKTHRLSNHARRASLSRHHFYLRIGKTHKLSDRFFFDLFILACDLCRSWRRTFLPGFPVGSPRGGGSLQAPLLPFAQACPKKE